MILLLTTSKPYGPSSPSSMASTSLSKEIQLTRMIFKYGVDAGLIDKPLRFGPTFKKPAARLMRAHRQKNGVRMFEAAQLRTIIDKADQPLKAMILLGINCGFGNHDCRYATQECLGPGRRLGELSSTENVNRATVPAVARDYRGDAGGDQHSDPRPKDREHDDLVFITKYGGPWAKETSDNPVSQRVPQALGRSQLHRPGLGFYALRHTFETIAGDSRDQVAVNAIMGHADASMAATYRERIEDDRLRAVVEHVHGWLFPKGDATQ